MGNVQGMLTLVLVASTKDKQDHYATIPTPETYEDAAAAAVKSFGRYMANPSADILLRSSIKNRKDEWIWADIAPENWRAAITLHPKEVGVFEVPKNSDKFLGGPLRFTFALEGESKISWSAAIYGLDDLDDYEDTLIDRPENYRDAVERSKQIIGRALPQNYDVFRFCYFPRDISSWVMFPTEAYTDNTVWRSVVPPPGGFLGVLASKANDWAV